MRRLEITLASWSQYPLPVQIVNGQDDRFGFAAKEGIHYREMLLHAKVKLPILVFALIAFVLLIIWKPSAGVEITVSSDAIRVRNGVQAAKDQTPRQEEICKGIKKPQSALQNNFYKMIEKITGRPPLLATDESYWILNLRTGRVTAIGHAPKPQMTAPTVPSPAFTRAYLFDTDKAVDNSTVFLFDLTKKKVERCQIPGSPLGWWSDQEILLKLSVGGFAAYDPATQKKRILLSDAKLTEWLSGIGIDLEPQKVATISEWNGKAYDHYVTDTHANWLAEISFLARLGPDGELSLLQKEFTAIP